MVTLQWLPQKDTAKVVGCTAATISIWKRDEAFEVWVAEGLRVARLPIIEAAKTAIALRTIAGNPKFGELLLAMLGYDGFAGDGLVGGGNATPGAPAAAAVAQVTFIGLPMPPTPAEAAAGRPPQGSNVIYRPVLPPAPPPPGGK